MVQLSFWMTFTDEVRINRRSLITMCLDYQKPFDSVPHGWLIKALELAKVPQLIIESNEPILINNITIEPMKVDESYKYLGLDENISYVGSINKERVKCEYFKRVKKIWESQLSGYNKHISYNAFAVSILIPTFDLLDWTIEDIEQIAIGTRKISFMTGNFHRNPDVDRLYIPRRKGGRGLKSIQIAFETSIISVRQHLQANNKNNKYLNNSKLHEKDKLMRAGEEVLQKMNVTNDPNLTPSRISKLFLQQVLREKETSYCSKQLRGYMQRNMNENTNIDHATSNQWLTNKYLTSHFEAYACAIREQEIVTKDLIFRRERKQGKQPANNNKCRLCKDQVEDITHVISSCGKLSSRYYLPLRHYKIYLRKTTNEK